MKKIISIVMIFCFLLSPKIYANDPLKDLNAKSLVLMEASTGEILYERNKDEKLPIASVTKIMTMLLIMEAIDSGKIKLDDMVSVSERAMSMGGSTMFLETGESLTVSDMLKGIAVASANDGAVAMAEHISGSESAFVDEMNKRAKELGMENTNFINTNGLDADGHYSSAKDVAIMSRELIKHDIIFDYTTIWTDTLRDGKFELANTNKLIRFYDGANGLKTGSTSNALCCLSATALRDGMQLIAVVLGSPDSKERFNAGRGLLDFGFANYSVKKGVEKGEEITKIAVIKGVKDQIGAISKDDFSFLSKKSDKEELEKKIIAEDIKAPVKKGDIIGKIEFFQNEKSVGEVDLLAGEDVEKKGYIIFLKDTFNKWICA